MLRPVLRAVLQPVLRSTFAGLAKRWAYNFDGIDDRGQLQFRAIDPDGNIDIEFRTGPIVPAAGSTDRTVISQCLTATFSGTSGKEFTLFFNSSTGALQALHGGNFFSSNSSAILAPNTKYRWQLQGSTQTFWVNDINVGSSSVTRGTARESTAQTVLMAQTHGSTSTFRGFGSGLFYDVKINGVLWSIADRNQSIQLPVPSGLGAELITQSVLENPASKGSQWTYLGDGRWQYVGDGSLNDLTFILFGSQPSAAFLEFEIESISGTIVCAQSGTLIPSSFNSVGVKRYYYPVKDHNSITNANCVMFKRQSGVASCIIKNISFKPLGTCNPLTLVNTNPDRWTEIDKSLSADTSVTGLHSSTALTTPTKLTGGQ